MPRWPQGHLLQRVQVLHETRLQAQPDVSCRTSLPSMPASCHRTPRSAASWAALQTPLERAHCTPHQVGQGSCGATWVQALSCVAAEEGGMQEHSRFFNPKVICKMPSKGWLWEQAHQKHTLEQALFASFAEELVSPVCSLSLLFRSALTSALPQFQE